MKHVKHTLKPIYNSESKILILGTMPSTISREQNFYYANSQNRFWNIMENIFNIKFKNNTEREKFLLKNNISLWDVIKECDIVGSKDSSIKNAIPNDIKSIIDDSKIKIIFTTGKTAYALYNKLLKNKIKINVICLPSPSSANARYSLEMLVNEYRIILNYLNHY